MVTNDLSLDFFNNSSNHSIHTYLLLLISMLWHRQAIFESKGDKLSSSAECRIRTLHTCMHTYIHTCMHACMHTYIHTCLLLLISMLWHRQAIFESKGDKLSSSAESRIRTHQGLRHQIASRLNSRWQTDWAIEDQAKNLNSTARPYDQRAFSPLDPTAVWHSHLALAIYMFVVVNFDALAQASDFRIERRQVVFLCWMQDSNPEGLWNPIFRRLNACWQTDWAIEDLAKKLELDSPSLWSASIQPTWPHCHLVFAPGSGYIHICCC